MLHPVGTTASGPATEPQSLGTLQPGHRPVSAQRGRLTAACLSALLIIFLVACGPGGEGGSAAGSAASSAAGAAAGTQSAGSPGTISIVIAIEPLRVGTTTITAQVRDGTGPLVGAEVTVRGDMTHAGMPPALGELREEQAGTYVSDAFDLSMAGDWIITIEVAAADGREATSESFVSVAAR